jgi:serine/threonine protein kinase
VLIESRELEPDTVIRGKYRILRLLGRGGMGTVYLAEHILLSRRRALKFISSDLSQDPRFLKRFRHEAQAAIELRHPNIVEVTGLKRLLARKTACPPITQQ